MLSKKFFNNKWVLFFYPSFLFLIFNLCFFNRYFPLSEGWWETYGYLINKGLMPYKDFYLAFPPLFIFYNAWLIKITSSFYCLRLIGVLFFCCNVILAQILLENFFERKIASVAALLASLFLLMDQTFIPKDYHTYTKTFATLSLILLCLIGKNFLQSNKGFLKVCAYSFLMGLFVGVLALIKQNEGVFLCFGILIAIMLLNSIKYWNTKKILILFMTGFGFITAISSIILLFFLHHIPIEYVKNIFISNNSKGNIFLVLFRFAIDKYNRDFIIISASLTTIYFLIAENYIIIPKKILCFLKSITALKKNKKCYQLSAFILALLTAIAANKYEGDIILLTCTLSFSIILGLLVNVFIFKKNIPVKILLIPLLMFAYCNTQTAGFNTTGLYFLILIASACFFKFCLNLQIDLKFFAASLIVLGLSFFINKILFPYNWWGLTQSSIFSAKYTIDTPQLKGIYFDKKTSTAFNLINSEISKYSKKDNDVLLFPNIPIFYYLNNKVPPYKAVVQWFDVISSQDIDNEQNDFKKNLPNIVIVLEPPTFVYAGHASLLGRPLAQHDFYQKLNNLVKEGVYTPKYTLYSDLVLKDLYTNNTVNQWFQFDKCNEKTKSLIFSDLRKCDANYSITKVNSYNMISTNNLKDEKIHCGDFLELTLQKSSIACVTDKLGPPISTDNFIVAIYVRSDLLK